MDIFDRKILVVGLGASGLAAARLLATRGAKVILNDGRSAEELPLAVALAAELDLTLALGAHEPEVFCAVDGIVVSPGVPRLAALDAAEKAGVPVIGE